MTKRYNLNQNIGFTLIELMVVTSIISLLSSIVLASLSTTKSKALIAKQQEEIHQASNDIAINLDKTDRTYTLTGNTDNYFKVDSGTYALQNISDGNGVIVSPSPFNRRTEVFAMAGGNDPSASASEIYYYYNNAWRQIGDVVDVSSKPLTQYFIIRTHSGDPDIHITLPNTVTYYGSTVQNGSPRPW